jgi:hypothetical protein
MGVKVEVISAPVFIDDGWQWKSKRVSDGKEIDYFVHPKYTHYGPNLYDYEAYEVNTML